MASNNIARLIAFYLPQFHPIPENDKWWGKGFTEWTNVAKAKPLFPGHYQPRIPADLGFYDLRVPETRAAQAELARNYGVEGFCYWHYWFAGRQLLDRPFNEVLQSGEPDFPFCLGWANQSWTGVWHGAPNRVLMEQTYPGMEDHKEHFFTVLDAFSDHRYITIDEKPAFIIFSPTDLPDSRRFTDYWRELAIKAGLPGLYFIGLGPPALRPTECGLDAIVLSNLTRIFRAAERDSLTTLDKICDKIIGTSYRELHRRAMSRPKTYSYRQAMKHATPALTKDYTQYPCVYPGWDHTPRSGLNGVVLHRSKPHLFQRQLRTAISQVVHRRWDERIVFVKSWNEWAEGNYLEPDQRFGRAYLEAIREELSR